MDKEKVTNIARVYYSRQDVQKAMFEFSQGREVVPSYMREIFGKRPDSFQYQGDIFELVKNGATSFHCSQELWKNPLDLSTELSEKQLNELRTGWDLLIDIDSKYLDYSKIFAKIIIKALKFYHVKNIGIKFSGSKGFHLLIPWKAFPKEIQGIRVSDTFPEWPRIITKFLIEITKEQLVKEISEISKQNKYVKEFQATKEVMPDLIAVSSRHLFRMPYSLHEKTCLASVVLFSEELENFDPKDANPLKIKIRNFMSNCQEGEATDLLREALDWYKNKNPEEFTTQKTNQSEEKEFKPIKIERLSEEITPPTIQKILQGVRDGRKRSLFILINFFRAIGLDRVEIEKIIQNWNQKNETPLKLGYIKSQLSWSYRSKIVPPPNYDKDYYLGMGITPTEEEVKSKNPVRFVSLKIFQKSKEAQEKFKTTRTPKTRKKKIS